MVSIYTLICPINNTVKYVGATTQTLENRLLQHCYNPASRKMRVWVNSLKDKKLKPIIKLKELVNPFDEIKKEIFWINYYIDLGVLLLNKSNNKSAEKNKTVIDFNTLKKRNIKPKKVKIKQASDLIPALIILKNAKEDPQINTNEGYFKEIRQNINSFLSKGNNFNKYRQTVRLYW